MLSPHDSIPDKAPFEAWMLKSISVFGGQFADDLRRAYRCGWQALYAKLREREETADRASAQRGLFLYAAHLMEQGERDRAVLVRGILDEWRGMA
jgi:hypothetical protein